MALYTIFEQNNDQGDPYVFWGKTATLNNRSSLLTTINAASPLTTHVQMCTCYSLLYLHLWTADLAQHPYKYAVSGYSTVMDGCPTNHDVYYEQHITSNQQRAPTTSLHMSLENNNETLLAPTIEQDSLVVQQEHLQQGIFLTLHISDFIKRLNFP